MSLSRALSGSTFKAYGRAIKKGVVANAAVAPTVVSITPLASGNKLSHTVGLGATVAAGNLLLVLVAADGFLTSNPNTTDEGWSRFAFFGNDAGCAFFKKKAVGNEGGTSLTVTCDVSEFLAAQCFRITTWSGDLDDVVTTTAATGSSSTAAPPSLTSGFGAVPTLWIAFAGYSTGHALVSGPANYGTPTDTGGLSTSNAQVRTGYRQLTAATEQPGTFISAGSSNWAANTIAVRGTG